MSYLPLSDSGLLNWTRNFLSELEGLVDPTTVGLTAQNVTDYTAAQADYHAKYNTANSQATRGGAAVLAKNQSKEVLVELSRSYAMTITNFQGVTDQQRFDFGLTIPDDEPTAVPVPSTPPVLTIVSTLGRTVKVQLRDFTDTEKRGKPDNVAGATLLMYVGEEAPVDPTLWVFCMNTTKTTVDYDFPPNLAAGSKVWLTAFWKNRREESGPAAVPASTRIGDTLAQAA
jgi:hypothetical protein